MSQSRHLQNGGDTPTGFIYCCDKSNQGVHTEHQVGSEPGPGLSARCPGATSSEASEALGSVLRRAGGPQVDSPKEAGHQEPTWAVCHILRALATPAPTSLTSDLRQPTAFIRLSIFLS